MSHLGNLGLITLAIIIAPYSAAAGSLPSAATNYISANIGTLIYVPAGTFQYDEKPGDKCNVPALHMSRYDITGAQFQIVTGITDPSTFSETGHPVETVSWYQAIVFCNDLSIKERLTPVYSINGSPIPSSWGTIPTTNNTIWDAVEANWSANGYRLPTEMEWMWAAMGAFSDIRPGDMGAGGINTNGYSKAFAGCTGSNNITNFAYTLISWLGGPLTDPVYNGAAPGPVPLRVMRGGCWSIGPPRAKIAFRDDYDLPSLQSDSVGFRVVRP